MEGLYRIGYLLLMGVILFIMFRRGGCCGHGHGHSGERYGKGNSDDSHDHGGNA